VLGHAIDTHHDTRLVCASLTVAAAAAGGTVTGLIFCSDCASEYTSAAFDAACDRLGVVQSVSRIGSALYSADCESQFSSPEYEPLSR
jgi:transposase InsO family protein